MISHQDVHGETSSELALDAGTNDQVISSASLKFVVMGVPRSGTSALAHALNLHPEIMCGIEYFPDVQSACAVSLADAFEHANYNHTPVCDFTRALYQRKKDRARVFGNKDPRYFFHLPYLNAKVPSCKKICIYRPRLDFWSSWDSRARDANDIHWERGQTGFFGVLELMCMLGALTDVPNCGEVLLVNYDQLFFGDFDTLANLYEYLGLTPDPTALATFRETYFLPAGISRKQSAGEEARSIYRYLQLGELEQRLFVRPTVKNTDIAGALHEYLRFSRALTAALIDKHFSEMPMTELAYFLGARQLRNALSSHSISARALKAIELDEQLAGRLRHDLLQLCRGFEEP